VRRIDVLVASHGDLDHRGGLPAVIDALPVAELWLPPRARADPDFRLLLERARANSVRVFERARGDTRRRVGDLEIATLWPPRDGVRRTRNDASLVLRVEVAGRRVLLTGDAGAEVEAALLEAPGELAADVLKVAHHGSRSASTAGFLAVVSPDVALVSAPCTPRAALPSPAALQRLRASGGSLWWTGRDGAAVVAVRRAPEPLVAWGWLSTPRRNCDRAELAAVRLSARGP
jgi:competence protein ComEC